MQTIFKRNVKWSVGLSNGQNFKEGVFPYELIKGELSPWERLKKYLADNDLHITSLSLYTDGGKTFNLPSIGKNPKFKAFQELEKPLQLNYSRLFAKDLEKNGAEDFLVMVEAVYAKYKLQLFVNEQNPKHSWVLVREVESA